MVGGRGNGGGWGGEEFENIYLPWYHKYHQHVVSLLHVPQISLWPLSFMYHNYHQHVLEMVDLEIRKILKFEKF